MTATPSARIGGLDVLRGIAIALVMLRHAFPALFPGAGVVGVVMFFAISGYLITGLLIDELDRTGRVQLRRFYLRRARRLIPALIVLVVVVVVVTMTLDPLDDRDKLGTTVLVALTWTGNLPLGSTSEATFHLWTLATEEQFYLCWPILLALGFAHRRIGATLLLAASACVVACMSTLWWLREDSDLAYALPTSWAICFVIGGGCRLLARPVVVPLWVTTAGLAALLILSVVPLRGHALTYLLGGPVIAALTAVLLLSWRSWVHVESALQPLMWLGTVSYGAYLWNYPLTLWLRPSLGNVAGPLAAVLTVAAAAASWYTIERPLKARPTQDVMRV